MNPKKVLITGATGFIGKRLVGRLTQMGVAIDCLVRKPCPQLAELGVHQINFDLSQSAVPLSCLQKYKQVFHLAAATTSLNSQLMIDVNSRLTQNLFDSLVDQDAIEKVVVVSSLAANGPCSDDQPVSESDSSQPVSNYGRSKLASEKIARRFAVRMPISIVRPPIVIGGGDGNSFEMFRMIHQTGIHFVPGFKTRNYSMIHVDDLVESLIAVAERGQSIDASDGTKGLYYAAADDVWTYAQVGKKIGAAMGRAKTRVVPVGPMVMRLLAAGSELMARIRGVQGIVNWDKTREALAGSWACSNQKIKGDTGLQYPISLEARIEQTIRWYRENGWLPTPRKYKRPAFGGFRQKQEG